MKTAMNNTATFREIPDEELERLAGGADDPDDYTVVDAFVEWLLSPLRELK